MRFNKSAISIALCTLFPLFSDASTVRGDVDYQLFRNFAENKGQFQAGKVNIPIYNKSGKYLGNVLPRDVPMPDFSSVEKDRYVTTLVHPQYVTSVSHNSARTFYLDKPENGLIFGQGKDQASSFIYKIVDRNDHSKLDFNAPRLNKMVTEVSPTELAQNLKLNDFRNSRYSAFARLGTGRQYVLGDDNQVTQLESAYVYPTGGVPFKLGRSTEFNKWLEENNSTSSINAKLKDLLDESSYLGYGLPLVADAKPGDSGSPLFGYDSVLKRWVLVGVTARATHKVPTGDSVTQNIYTALDENFIADKRNEDIGAYLNINSSSPVYWSNLSKGTSRLSSSSSIISLDIANSTDLNHGKDLIIQNNADLVLRDNINQGAGGLYFLSSGKVRGENVKTTWIGSGIFTDENTKVEWQVKNPAGDRLSKLGKGELVVNGIGRNDGSLSVGEGSVVLAQRADENGNKRAFSEVNLASGRGKITVADTDQLKDVEISFGYRGGIFDLNGTTIAKGRIIHTDDGATFINTNKKTESIITVGGNQFNHFKGNLGLTPSKEGVLNFTYAPRIQDSVFSLSGNVKLNGYVYNKDGSLVFSGAPVPYAYKYDTKEQIVPETDWTNREVKAKKFYANNDAKMEFGRNLTRVEGDFQGNKQGTFVLGFVNGESLHCDNVGCNAKSLSEDILKTLPRTEIQGNATLRDDSKLIVGRANFAGKVIATRRNSKVHLKPDSLWILTGDSQVKNLVLDKGSKIHLNPDNEFSAFNKLTVGNLSGQGHFRFSTNLAELAYNKLHIKGKVSGTHQISIVDSGVEPNLENLGNGLSGVKLIEISKEQAGEHRFELEKGYVDAGAYRYVISPDLEFSVSKRKHNTVHNSSADWSMNSNISNEWEERFNRYRELFKIDTNIFLNPTPPTNPQPTGRNADEPSKPTFSYRSMDGDESNTSGIGNVEEVKKPKFSYRSMDDVESDEFNIDELPPQLGLSLPELISPDASNVVAVRAKGTQAEVMSEYANAAVRGFAHTQRTVSESFDALSQHNVKLSTTEPQMAWIAHSQEKSKFNSTDYRSYKSSTNRTQIGSEWAVSDALVFGATYAESRSKIDGHRQDKFRLAGLYAKYQHSTGVFIASDIQGGRNKQSSGHHNAYRVGLSIGKNLNWNNTRLTPYVGIGLTHLSRMKYEQDGAMINISSQRLPTYHLGLNVAHEFNLGDVKITPFAGVHYLGSNKKQSIQVNNASFNQRFDNVVKYQVGITMNIKQFNIGLSGSTAKGKALSRANQAELKIGFNW